MGKRKRGAPTKYKKRYCDDIIAYFRVPPYRMATKRTYYQNGNIKSEEEFPIANDLPTFQGFADSIGVHVDTLSEWRKVHPEFSEAYARARAIQDSIVQINGLSGLYNSQYAQFFSKNCLGYKDKQEIDAHVTGSVEDGDAEKALKELGYVKSD